MLRQGSIGAIASGTILLVAALAIMTEIAVAGEETKYPDLRGQWAGRLFDCQGDGQGGDGGAVWLGSGERRVNQGLAHQRASGVVDSDPFDVPTHAR